MASPSSSSESLLAFSYDTRFDEVTYPHGHDQSQPQTPVSESTIGPISRHPGGDSLDPSSQLTSLPTRPTTGSEEYELEPELGNRERGSKDIDPFSQGELVVMSFSTLLVLALICISIMLTFGTIGL